MVKLQYTFALLSQALRTEWLILFEPFLKPFGSALKMGVEVILKRAEGNFGNDSPALRTYCTGINRKAGICYNRV